MATEIIPTSQSAANSSDFSVTAGIPVTLFLKNGGTATVMDSAARSDIQVKDAAGNYYKVGELNGIDPIKVIDGPGTYRVAKLAGPNFGVDKG